MNKTKIYFTAACDTVFLAFVFFLVFYYIFLKKTSQATALLITIGLTAVFVFAVSLTAVRILTHKEEARQIKHTNDAAITALLLMSESDFASYVSDLKLLSDGEKLIAINTYPNEPLKASDILPYLRLCGKNRICLVTTGTLSSDARSVLDASPFEYKLIEHDALIKTMREANRFPDMQNVSVPTQKRTPRERFSHMIKTVLSGENTVRYLRYAAVMSVGALFTRFNVYFTVTSCIFIGLCAASFLYSRQSKKIF